MLKNFITGKTLSKNVKSINSPCLMERDLKVSKGEL